MPLDSGAFARQSYFGERFCDFGSITPRAFLIPLPGRAWRRSACLGGAMRSSTRRGPAFLERGIARLLPTASLLVAGMLARDADRGRKPPSVARLTIMATRS